MSQANEFFQAVGTASPTINVVVRPDPNSASNVLISAHSDLHQTRAIPIDSIQSAIKCGELRGLPPEFLSLDVTFKQAFLDNHEIAGALASFKLNDGVRTIPVKCYDENKKEVPCP